MNRVPAGAAFAMTAPPPGIGAARAAFAAKAVGGTGVPAVAPMNDRADTSTCGRGGAVPLSFQPGAVPTRETAGHTVPDRAQP